MITYEIDTHKTAIVTPRKLPKMIKEILSSEQKGIIHNKLDEENYMNHSTTYFYFSRLSFFRKINFYVKVFRNFTLIIANKEGEWDILPSKLYYYTPSYYTEIYDKIWNLSWHTVMSGKYNNHEIETIFSITQLTSIIEKEEE